MHASLDSLSTLGIAARAVDGLLCIHHTTAQQQCSAQ